MAVNYPLPKFHFLVEWGGTRLGFTEVSGLEFETEVIEYREGSSKTYNKSKQPGLTKYANVTLKRGVVTGDLEFFKYWRDSMQFMHPQKRDITIKLLDDEHSPVLTWVVRSAWPCKVKYGDLNAGSNEILIESMELAHEGLSIIE
jgi:phage tail-like protein